MKDGLFQKFKDRFLIAEIQIIFPVVIVFFILSVFSIYISIKYYLQDSNMLLLLLWSLVPFLTYGTMVALTIFQTRTVANLFTFRDFETILPSDLRKNRYTQIFIAKAILLSSFGTFDAVAWVLMRSQWAIDGFRIAKFGIATIVALACIFLLNRRFHNKLTRSLFILWLILVFGFTDSAHQTIEGRSLFFQIIPIMLASFTLFPSASFFTAVVTTTLLTSRGIIENVGINSTAFLGIYLIAFVSWLISKGYEDLLHQFEMLGLVLETRVSEKTKHLTDANIFKSKFLAQISHELQSPIISITLFLRKVGQILESEECKALETEAQRLLDMAVSISAVSKLELEIIEEKLSYSWIDIQEEFMNKGLAFRHRFQEKDVRFSVNQQAEEIVFPGVKAYFSRIIDNLVSNALKYSNESGQISVDYFLQGDFVVIQISDTGIGIPPEDLPHIFDRFRRASNVEDRPGTGLGLSMVHEMVTAMKGTIAVESTPGQGTTFTLTFPATAP